METNSTKIKIISLLVLITSLNQINTIKTKAITLPNVFSIQQIKGEIAQATAKMHQLYATKATLNCKPISPPLTNTETHTAIIHEDPKIETEIYKFFKLLLPDELESTLGIWPNDAPANDAKDLIVKMASEIKETPIALDALLLAHLLNFTPMHIYQYIEQHTYDQLMQQLLTGDEKRITFKGAANKPQTNTPLMAIYKKYTKTEDAANQPAPQNPWEQLIQKTIFPQYDKTQKPDQQILLIKDCIKQLTEGSQTKNTDVSEFQQTIEYLDKVILRLDEYLYAQNKQLATIEAKFSSPQQKHKDEVAAYDERLENYYTEGKLEQTIDLNEEQRKYLEQLHAQLIQAIPEIINKKQEEYKLKKEQDARPDTKYIKLESGKYNDILQKIATNFTSEGTTATNKGNNQTGPKQQETKKQDAQQQQQGGNPQQQGAIPVPPPLVLTVPNKQPPQNQNPGPNNNQSNNPNNHQSNNIQEGQPLNPLQNEITNILNKGFQNLNNKVQLPNELATQIQQYLGYNQINQTLNEMGDNNNIAHKLRYILTELHHTKDEILLALYIGNQLKITPKYIEQAIEKDTYKQGITAWLEEIDQPSLTLNKYPGEAKATYKQIPKHHAQISDDLKYIYNELPRKYRKDSEQVKTKKTQAAILISKIMNPQDWFQGNDTNYLQQIIEGTQQLPNIQQIGQNENLWFVAENDDDTTLTPEEDIASLEHVIELLINTLALLSAGILQKEPEAIRQKIEIGENINQLIELAQKIIPTTTIINCKQDIDKLKKELDDLTNPQKNPSNPADGEGLTEESNTIQQQIEEQTEAVQHKQQMEQINKSTTEKENNDTTTQINTQGLGVEKNIDFSIMGTKAENDKKDSTKLSTTHENAITQQDKQSAGQQGKTPDQKLADEISNIENAIKAWLKKKHKKQGKQKRRLAKLKTQKDQLTKQFQLFTDK